MSVDRNRTQIVTNTTRGQMETNFRIGSPHAQTGADDPAANWIGSPLSQTGADHPPGGAPLRLMGLALRSPPLALRLEINL